MTVNDRGCTILGLNHYPTLSDSFWLIADSSGGTFSFLNLIKKKEVPCTGVNLLLLLRCITHRRRHKTFALITSPNLTNLAHSQNKLGKVFQMYHVYERKNNFKKLVR